MTWKTQLNQSWDLYLICYHSALPWHYFLREQKSCRGGSILSRKSLAQSYRYSSYNVLPGGQCSPRQPKVTSVNDLQHPGVTGNQPPLWFTKPIGWEEPKHFLFPLKMDMVIHVQFSSLHLSGHMGKSRFFPFREGSSNSYYIIPKPSSAFKEYVGNQKDCSWQGDV